MVEIPCPSAKSVTPSASAVVLDRSCGRQTQGWPSKPFSSDLGDIASSPPESPLHPVARAPARLAWAGLTFALLVLMSIGHVATIGLSHWTEHHDLDAHVEYCQLIAKNHALPHPRAGWTTYHPPLFYLFAQLFHPLQDDRGAFVSSVRWVNAYLFGSMFLFAMLGIVHALKLQKMAALFVVSFLITLPSVVQLFSGFNTDPMATAFTALTALSALKFYQANRRKGAVAWGAIVLVAGILALYAKFTSVFAFLALGVFLVVGLATRRLNARALWLLGIGTACFAALLPYLVLHNYRNTGNLFPHNVEKPADMAFASLDLQEGRLRFLLTPPLVTDREWSTPYATTDAGEQWWSKRNMVASAFATSLYGEWDFNRRGRPDGTFLLSKNTWAWLGVWVHLGFLYLALASRSQVGRAALLLAALIFCSHVAHVMGVMPFHNAANFRYYTWILLPLAVAAITRLQQKATWGFRSAACAAIAGLGLGTLIHLGFVFSAL